MTSKLMFNKTNTEHFLSSSSYYFFLIKMTNLVTGH